MAEDGARNLSGSGGAVLPSFTIPYLVNTVKKYVCQIRIVGYGWSAAPWLGLALDPRPLGWDSNLLGTGEGRAVRQSTKTTARPGENVPAGLFDVSNCC